MTLDLIEEIIKTSEKIISKYNLCDNCLGRAFGYVGYGLTNNERGFLIKTLIYLLNYKSFDNEEHSRKLIIKLAESNYIPARKFLEKKGINVEANKCFVCGNLLSEVSSLAEKILEKIRDYEFSSFVIGTKVPKEILKREEKIREEFKLNYAEGIKKELNREIGKKILESLNKTVDFQNPDITAIIDVRDLKVDINVKPLLVYGKYRKLKKYIPQSSTKEHVIINKINLGSIEDFICKPILEITKGNIAILHAAGREDVDVITMGHGRPFIVEVRKPKKRNIDLKAIEREIKSESHGTIEVSGLKLVNDRRLIGKLKALAQHARKTYEALVKYNRAINKESLAKIENEFRDLTIRQRTPLRVLYRRKDKVRLKKVYEIKAELLNENTVKFIIKCQGGLYVKELITGDESRTKPSIADFLGQPENIDLKIIDIEEMFLFN